MTVVASHRRAQCALVGIVLSLSAALGFGAADPLLLTNGNIYTGNDAQPRAQAIVVVDGRIAFVGDTAAATQRAPANAKRIDLSGQTVLPGLVDAHMHLEGVGFREISFNLEGTTGIADLQARLRKRAAESPQATWIVGRGWIESQWKPAAFPTKEQLDAAVSNKPVFLERGDGHGAVVNSLALKQAGIDRSTPNPKGGEILKDPKTGEPTGMLIDHATLLVEKLLPAPTEQELARAIEVGAERSVRLGWTQVHVAGSTFEESEALRKAVQASRIKLRIYDTLEAPGAAADRLLQQPLASVTTADRFTLRGIKLYMDGALGSRGAALLEPYSDSPQSSGLLLNSEEKLSAILIQALRQGIQIQTHAIGDRGNRMTLDLYEKAFAAVPPAQRKVAEPRWRIEHAQVISAQDIPRFKKLGVISSMQPSHAISDLYFAPSRLGPARLPSAYAWRSLLDSGATVVAGSDAPVERGEPMIEFYAAVTRRALNGFAGPDWHLEQRVTRAEVLRMLTLAPAHASFEEKRRGSIESSKVADLTVLSADIMQIPEAEILKTRCVMTLIDGEIVYAEQAASKTS